MASEENGFIEIASVLVNPEIFTRPYACDVVRYGCKSMCCYRSCIVPPHEAERIEKHLDGILSYLSRRTGRRSGRTARSLVFVQTMSAGCVIHDDEARPSGGPLAGRTSAACSCSTTTAPLSIRTRRAPLLRRAQLRHRERPCLGGVQVCGLRAVSPVVLHAEDGKRVMSIQDTPYLNHIPA